MNSFKVTAWCLFILFAALITYLICDWLSNHPWLWFFLVVSTFVGIGGGTLLYDQAEKGNTQLTKWLWRFGGIVAIGFGTLNGTHCWSQIDKFRQEEPDRLATAKLLRAELTDNLNTLNKEPYVGDPDGQPHYPRLELIALENAILSQLFVDNADFLEHAKLLHRSLVDINAVLPARQPIGTHGVIVPALREQVLEKRQTVLEQTESLVELVDTYNGDRE
jgi:hypothetical protein